MDTPAIPYTGLLEPDTAHAAAPPVRLRSTDLLELARSLGADDCGLVAIDDPLIDEDRPYILNAFPATRVLLVLVGRMHREPVRSPARSIANHEFHASGDHVDHVARPIVRQLEDRGVAALNPAMAFPMEMDAFPERGWVVSHKRAAEAAGLGKMGIHRSLIHPRFGSFVLLGTVLIAAEIDGFGQPLDFNPCLGCKLCVAACPVGAIKPTGTFDFSACLTHNYQQFMGGFVNFVEDIADSRSARDLRDKASYSDVVTRWQSLAYGPNYNAAYCIAVCPAGNDVIGSYLADQKQHIAEVLEPLTRREEPVYVVRGTDAADYVARRFPHKKVRWVRPSVRVTSISGFLSGLRLAFQPGKSKGLDATYHFAFRGPEAVDATVIIRDRTLSVTMGHVGTADLAISADGASWLRFLNKERSIARLILTRAIRFKGPVRLMLAFGRCFPA
jgi:epoxyqueuosine reductase QueG